MFLPLSQSPSHTARGKAFLLRLLSPTYVKVAVFVGCGVGNGVGNGVGLLVGEYEGCDDGDSDGTGVCGGKTLGGVGDGFLPRENASASPVGILALLGASAGDGTVVGREKVVVTLALFNPALRA